jgi:hypothetical protein
MAGLETGLVDRDPDFFWMVKRSNHTSCLALKRWDSLLVRFISPGSLVCSVSSKVLSGTDWLSRDC